MDLQDVQAIGKVLDPRSGKGWVESFILVVLVTSVVVFNFLDIEVSRPVASALALVLGWWFRGSVDRWVEENGNGTR